jgi:hypothetical protein
VFQEQINNKITMNSVGGKTQQDAQVADAPNDITGASLHNVMGVADQQERQGRHDAASGACVKSKMAVFPRKAGV